jgi:hypothetical protein
VHLSRSPRDIRAADPDAAPDERKRASNRARLVLRAINHPNFRNLSREKVPPHPPARNLTREKVPARRAPAPRRCPRRRSNTLAPCVSPCKNAAAGTCLTMRVPRNEG